MKKTILILLVVTQSPSIFAATECFNHAESTILARITKMSPSSHLKKLEIGYMDYSANASWVVTEKIENLSCNNNVADVDLAYCRNTTNEAAQISRFEKILLTHVSTPFITKVKGYMVELFKKSSPSKSEYFFDSCIHNAAEQP